MLGLKEHMHQLGEKDNALDIDMFLKNENDNILKKVEFDTEGRKQKGITKVPLKNI